MKRKKIIYALLVVCSLVFILNSELSSVSTYSNSNVFEQNNFLFTVLSFSDGPEKRVFLNYPLVFLIILTIYDLINLILKSKKNN